MAAVTITRVHVINSDSMFTDTFQFQIDLQVLPPVPTEELEWRVIYVGSANDESHDQQLDEVSVAPPLGSSSFVFEASAPDPSRIPEKDLLEVTVVLLTCSYRGKEFIRIGYYVNNDFGDPQHPLNLSPPEHPMQYIHLIHRHVLAEKPRVTRFQIPWDQDENEYQNMMMQEHSLQCGQTADDIMDMEIPMDDDFCCNDNQDDDDDYDDQILADDEAIEDAAPQQSACGGLFNGSANNAFVGYGPQCGPFGIMSSAG